MFECTMPTPPSVNNLFVNAPRGRGRFPSQKYKAWMRAAIKEMALIGTPPLIDTPVHIFLEITGSSRNDLDNCAKAVIDMLVAQGVLLNDNKKVVRRITLEFAEVVGARVRIFAHEKDRRVRATSLA